MVINVINRAAEKKPIILKNYLDVLTCLKEFCCLTNCYYSWGTALVMILCFKI